MSFTVTKLVSLCIYPLTQSMLLCLIGILVIAVSVRGRLFGLLVQALAMVWLWIASTALFADALMASLEADARPKTVSALPDAQAIVVLGGVDRGDVHFGTLPDLHHAADRLIYGAKLFQTGKAPLVVLSGGSRDDERPEAERMRDIMHVIGIPDEALLLERNSRTTEENAVYAAALLGNKGIERVLLVTSGYHMIRAQRWFEKQGFDVIPAPTDFQVMLVKPSVPRWLPTAQDLARTTRALHEYAGLAVQAVK